MPSAGSLRTAAPICYILRVSQRRVSTLVLSDHVAHWHRQAQSTVQLRAQLPGANSGIKATVDDATAVTTTLFKPAATITSSTLSTLVVSSSDDAAQFRPGDRITWSTTSEPNDVFVLHRRVVDPAAGTAHGQIQLGRRAAR